MNKFLSFIFLLSTIVVAAQETPKTQNVILVTFDGYRWQEMFKGAQKKLIGNTKLVKDIPSLQNKYWADDAITRREKLTPFIWNTVAKQGSIIGERMNASKMQVTNIHRFSYPGYSEIFSGWGNRKINSNDYPDNPNHTIWDFLQADAAFKNKIVAVATWDAFPRIINTKRNGVPVYVNIKDTAGTCHSGNILLQGWDTKCPASNGFITEDSLTYHFAKEYIVKNHPRFAFIGFDETDEMAHEGKYDSYLNSANQLDGYMQDLWNFIQTDPQYKDNTTLIITCDHGRGHLGNHMWQHHGGLVFSSNKIWLAAIGAGIKNQGVLKKGHFYQKQIAATITKLFGKKFSDEKKIGKPIDEILN
ncbi:MAG: alkaline phosphatase family protein [Bacteroidetes bacterium]|nr:alkaline phosphatase family protein [Bacteroidota bacterium]